MAAELQVPDLVLHAFTDGPDTLATSGAGYLKRVERWMAEAGGGRVGSVVARYYAMDRDRRWDRIQRAYDLLVHGRAEHHADGGEAAARQAYERGETDEFISPVLVGEEARIGPDDPVIAFNFRPDRMREITRAPGGARPRRAAGPRWGRAGEALRDDDRGREHEHGACAFARHLPSGSEGSRRASPHI